jgi:hypothetical protein
MSGIFLMIFSSEYNNHTMGSYLKIPLSKLLRIRTEFYFEQLKKNNTVHTIINCRSEGNLTNKVRRLQERMEQLIVEKVQ